MLDEWHPRWREIVEPVSLAEQHLTLAWLDVVSADAGALTARRIATALTIALAEFPKVTLNVTGVSVSTHGVHLDIERTPELEHLAEVVGSTMRDLLGRTAPVKGPGPDWKPHIAVARGIADVETSSGPLDLPPDFLPSTQPVRTLRVLDHDNWPDPERPAYHYGVWDELTVPVDMVRYQALRNGHVL